MVSVYICFVECESNMSSGFDLADFDKANIYLIFSFLFLGLVVTFFFFACVEVHLEALLIANNLLIIGISLK